MHTPKQSQIQILIQSPDVPIATRALTLNPNSTLRNLKLSLLPPQTLDSFFFTLHGKALHDSSTLQKSGINPLSTLVLRFRLPGGGGDGGATGAESRDCYLNMYAIKKPDKVDPNEQRLSKWTTCSLSFEPLRHPCVVDRLGNVFNKEALVEGLLGKKLPKAFGHIRGLKDMVPIELSVIPGLESDNGGESAGARYQCPITGLEFNGKYRFFALKTCGHVLSAKALKEVKSSACLVCHEGFKEEDKIPINGSEEEVAALRERMEEERAKLREKKAKKVKNGEAGVNGDEDVSLDSRLSGKKHGIDAKAVGRVDAKMEKNGKAVNGGVVVKGEISGVKRLKAAQAPANATSKVYASIFTSSRKSEFKETYMCRSLPLGRN
ncbi:hypothetical protein PVL29_014569 [Vitis rotundifolia]|uniref:Ubiquitin-like domain-containing protein n=1 Tax=Vitis rotundifolia TaxID=103349 RepID=A0AA38ZIQ0_VITRO|nr:hypothetical protein PVL29_014569 [Vitis rotundifolia]